MLSLSVRNLLAHKLRFAMTTFAVVLGVGFVVGAFVVTDTLRGSVNELFASVNQGVDVSVRPVSNLSGSGTTSSGGRVPGDLVPVVADVDGVAAAEGTLSGYAQLLAPSGEPVTTTGAPFLGVSWGEDDDLYPVTLDEGRKPRGLDEVAIDRGQADEFGFQVGDTTTVLLAEGNRQVEVVGIFTFGETNSLLGARLTAFGPDAAFELFDGAAGFDTIDVAAAPGVAPAELAARIGEVLPDGVEAITQQEVVDQGAADVAGFIDVFQNALLAFAGVALFVSAFFINNTFAIILGQRVRELGLVRALGASSGQVMASVVLEALAVGLLASLIGVGVGIGIAEVLRAVLSAGGFDLPAGSLVLAGRTWAAAAVVGVGVTLVASVVPAVRASRVPPVAAMSATVRLSSGSSARRLVVGAVLTLAGVGLVLAGLFVWTETAAVVGGAGVGALAVFIGVAMLSPVVVGPAARVLGWPMAKLLHSPGQLARANAGRDPYRTARTSSALMIGLALVTTVFVVGTSLKDSFAASIERSVQADFVISTESFTGFSPQVVEQLRQVPDLTAVTGVRFDRFAFEGAERDLVAADPAAVGQVIDLDVRSGSLADLDDGSIFLHQDPAADAGVEVGDTVSVRFATGEAQQLTVAGIYADSTYAGNYFVSLELFDRFYPSNQTDAFAFATAAEGADPAVVRAEIEAALADYPQVVIEDRSEFNASQQAQIDQLLVAVNGLLVLALVIALLGIVNTLALSVVERTREIGLLRAVGMSRRQTAQMVTAESVVMALFGALLGVALGLAFGVATAAAMPPSVITTIAVPVGTLIGVVVLASVFGVLAGLLPARRAARLNVLQAIATE